MAVQSVVVTPSLVIDDGVIFIFAYEGVNNNTIASGFVHEPVSAAEAIGNPPVIWSASTNPQTWVETLKYSVRSQKQILISYDDAVTVQYTDKTGQTTTLYLLYGVTG